jgi:hypothetical protein
MKFNSQTVTDLATNKMPQPYYRFDGINDQILVSADSNLSAGYCDFSQLVSFKTPISALFGGLAFVFYRDAGTNLKEFFRCSSSQIEWYSQDGTGNASYVTANLALDADTRYTIVAVADRSDTNHLYINGREVTIVGANSVSDAYSIDYSANLYIGNYASQNYATGELYAYQRWNKALTADEVKELSSGASVPYKYKGASQTELLTNGGLESWNSGTSLGNSWGTYSGGSSLTRVTDGDRHDGTYGARFNINSGDGNILIYQSVFEPGLSYRVSFWAKGSTGFNARVAEANGASNFSGAGLAVNFTVTTSWQHFMYEFTAKGISGSSSTITIARFLNGGGAGNNLYVDNISVTRIGAVAEYDGSTAGAHQWGDKSGNELHGTVGDGAGGATAPTLENTPYDTGTEYEEGTWTPVYAPASGAFSALTMEVFSASYIKIGNKVTVQAGIRTDGTLTINTGTGDLQINGLPFNGAGSIAVATSMRFASGKYPTGGQVESSYIILTERAAITGTTNECAVDSLSTSGEANQNQISFSATYIAT